MTKLFPGWVIFLSYCCWPDLHCPNCVGSKCSWKFCLLLCVFFSLLAQFRSKFGITLVLSESNAVGVSNFCFSFFGEWVGKLVWFLFYFILFWCPLFIFSKIVTEYQFFIKYIVIGVMWSCMWVSFSSLSFF